MNVVTLSHPVRAKGEYRDAANGIDAWYKVANWDKGVNR
jgi:hypothetical protein